MGLLDSLRAIVGDAHAFDDPERTASYSIDWTGRWSGRARAVVRPGSTGEVVEILHVCREERAAIVPQGGNTGLVGGSVPHNGEVVLSLVRLNQLSEVDAVSAQVTAGAGVTLEALQDHARSAGLDFAVDLGARSSATVGGLVATNAGGLRAWRYGSMRAQVLGVEAVLADGSVVSRLSGLRKDNTGYDLAGLLCGSEGTLGIVTKARLALIDRIDNPIVALVGIGDLEGALAAFGALRASLDSLTAVELMLPRGIEVVCAHTGKRPPMDTTAGAYLLIECAGRRSSEDELLEALGQLDAHDVIVALDATEQRRLWELREGHPEAINALCPAPSAPHKLDVTVPLAGVADFVGRVEATVARLAPTAELMVYGHLGDGNLHVNIAGPPSADHTIDDAVLDLVIGAGGSISAEHGIGVAKRRYLGRDRTPADVAAMRAIKRSLDPGDMLNPGVLFP
ncbi:MAG: FAD-binding oxidoreductase [Actinomycetota bacterium]